MTAEERNQRLSETFDAMEAGEATIDDWWNAVFPTVEWCEYELKQLSFHGNYDALYEIVETANVDSDFPVIPDEALVYRTLTPETDVLDHDERATVITALRYRKHYLHDLLTAETELPKGDILLYCQHCKRRTQHTETETLPGGYPLLECVICDGGRLL